MIFVGEFDSILRVYFIEEGLVVQEVCIIFLQIVLIFGDGFDFLYLDGIDFVVEVVILLDGKFVYVLNCNIVFFDSDFIVIFFFDVFFFYQLLKWFGWNDIMGKIL